MWSDRCSITLCLRDLVVYPNQRATTKVKVYTKFNLSGILNQTLKDVRLFLQNPNHEQPYIQQTENNNETFIESRAARQKSMLIITAKASHRKTFMETCLSRNSPPKQINLWIQPHVYHLNHVVEKQWRDVLHRASLDLTRTSIQHYNQVIQQERKSLEEIKQESIDHLTQIMERRDKEQTMKTWK